MQFSETEKLFAFFDFLNKKKLMEYIYIISLILLSSKKILFLLKHFYKEISLFYQHSVFLLELHLMIILGKH